MPSQYKVRSGLVNDVFSALKRSFHELCPDCPVSVLLAEDLTAPNGAVAPYAIVANDDGSYEIYLSSDQTITEAGTSLMEALMRAGKDSPVYQEYGREVFLDLLQAGTAERMNQSYERFQQEKENRMKIFLERHRKKAEPGTYPYQDAQSDFRVSATTESGNIIPLFP